MTNTKTEQPEEVQQPVNVNSAETPGTQLTKAREALGLTQQQVADRLHLRLNNIQDIESDTHQKAVSITFTKGYVRIYAKLVGLPSDPLLTAFDALHSDEKTPAKLQSFSQRVAKEAHDERWMMVTYLVGFLVVASVVIWWFQQSDKPIATRFDEFSNGVVEQVKSLSTDDAEQQSTNGNSDGSDIDQQPDLSFSDEVSSTQDRVEEALEDSLDTASQGASQAYNEVESTVTDAAENTSNAVRQYSNREIEAANETVETTQSAIADTSRDLVEAASNDDITESVEDTSFDTAQNIADNTQQEAQEAVASVTQTVISADGYELNADGTVDVVFTFKDDCWVSVKDVNKETMAYGVKKKGRVMSVSGVPPVRVILGAPQNVEIDFGGQAVDMSVHEAGRSANFRLPVSGE